MITGSEVLRALGLTMIHSIWEGAIILALVLFVPVFIPKTTARCRYALMFSGLLLLLAVFCATFVVLCRPHSVYGMPGGIGLSGTFPATSGSESSPWFLIGNFTDWLTTLLEPYYSFIALCWITGFIITGIQTTGGFLLTRKIVLKDTALGDTYLNLNFEKLKHLLHITRQAKIRVTQRMVSPMVVGFLKPVVILPLAAVSGLSISQLEAVLIHELAHIRRFDHLLIVIQAFARQVLFFHPAAWYLNREIERERENCCDDLVVQIQNNSLNYIKALTMIQEMNLGGVAPVNALAAKHNHLLNRIKRMIRPEPKYSTFLRLSAAFLFIATIGISAMTLMISGNNQGNRNLSENKFLISPPSARNADSSLVAGPALEKSREIVRDKDGVKKKMKIVIVDDTIQEMTVNGKLLSRDEMKEYQDEIGKIQQELEASQRDLESVNSQLKDAQRELEFAQQQLNDEKDPYNPELSELNRQLRGAFSQLPKDFEHARQVMQSEEFREQMKKAQAEAMKAFEEARKVQHEYWYQHQDELKEQIRKAQEETRKAMETFREQHEYLRSHPEIRDHVPPCVPVSPDIVPITPLVVPDIDLLMPVIPEVPEIPDLSPSLKEHDKTNDNATESLDSKLRELEDEQ